MGAGNCLFCAGKREIPWRGTAGLGFVDRKTIENGIRIWVRQNLGWDMGIGP